MLPENLQPAVAATDSELLLALRRQPSASAIEALLHRYGAYAAALVAHATTDAAEGDGLITGIFTALARSGRRIRRRAYLPEWLFQAAQAATKRHQKLARSRPPVTATAPATPTATDRPPILLESPVWPARFLQEVGRLRSKERDAFIARHLVGQPLEDAAKALRRKPAKVEKLANRALQRVRTRCQRGRKALAPDQLERALAYAAQGIPAALETAPILAAVHAALDRTNRQTPPARLGASILAALTWAKWRRWFGWSLRRTVVIVVIVACFAATANFAFQKTGILSYLIEMGSSSTVKRIPALAQPSKPWPELTRRPLLTARFDDSADSLFRSTNVWPVRLVFSAEQWQGIQPNRLAPNLQFNTPDGRMNLRHTNAQRSGVAGMLGFDFPWTHGTVEFGGTRIPDAAVRFKGNGTFLGSLYTLKRPFKVDLDKFQKGRRFAGVSEFTFNNLIEDSSRMHDALGYEVFRQLGVPASRTAYAWLSLDVAGSHTNRSLGLYALIESVDGDFARDRFGDRDTPIFKPVTQDLFLDLGTNWTAYDAIYDLKTRATPAQRARVAGMAHLLTHADDDTYARRVGEFIDLDEFARFLAGQVLLSSYDGFLSTGQNYMMYLDPRTSRFGFIPWDLDHAWGEFPYVGTSVTRERASIWKPWTGPNRFLERTLAVPEFRDRYRRVLEEALTGPFRPDHLLARIDALTPIVRECVEAESPFWLERFDKAVSSTWDTGPRDGPADTPDRPVHQLKRFIVNRAASIRDQLDGRSTGVTFPPAFSDRR